MARMFPARCPAARDGAPVAEAERLLFERLSRELDEDWSIVHDCEVGAGDEAASVAFALVHERIGVALIGLAAEGEEAEEAAFPAAALRATLARLGFAQRFRGHLTIVALRLGAAERVDLRRRLAAAFAPAPATSITDPGWVGWLVRHLAAQRAERPVRRGAGPVPPRLDAPDREDAWRVAEAPRQRPAAPGGVTLSDAPRRDGPVRDAPTRRATAEVTRMRVTGEPLLASRNAVARPASWLGMVLALLVVAAVLVGMALLSHGDAPPDGAPPPAVSGSG